MAKFVGKSSVSFTDSQGVPVKGYSLYFLEAIPASQGDGFRFVCGRSQGKTKSSTLFMSVDDFNSSGLQLGKEYNLLYDQFGHIMRDYITPIK